MTGNCVENPLVTVLLTVYNRPSVVSTIRSILNQSYKNFEFLIIDNASTDSTCDVIRQFSDKRIKLIINEKNFGQTYSLNKGLELAKGKYIARIDADDIALPKRLEKQVAVMEENHDYGLCGSWIQYITDDNRLTFLIKTCTTDEGIRFLQTISCAMFHPTVMIRKSIVDNYNIKYDSTLKIAEDYDMWGKILKYSKAMNLSEVLLYYRRGKNNDSRKNMSITRREYYITREKICRDYLSVVMYNKMEQMITIEKKQIKSILDMITICFYYCQYLHQFSRKNSDYALMRKLLIFHSFLVCIIYNDSVLARHIKYMYKFLCKVLYLLKKIIKR